VKLGQVEEAARDEERGDHRRPSRQVGEPVERAETRVDDVEPLALEGVGGGIDVGGDKPAVEVGVRREGVGGFDPGGGEVEADDRRAAARPGERVEAEVALEVDKALARDVADLLDRERVQRAPSGPEALDVVEAAGGMDRDALVPPGAICRQAGIQGQP
jgi:hypothetical protein